MGAVGLAESEELWNWQAGQSRCPATECSVWKNPMPKVTAAKSRATGTAHRRSDALLIMRHYTQRRGPVQSHSRRPDRRPPFASPAGICYEYGPDPTG